MISWLFPAAASHKGNWPLTSTRFCSRMFRKMHDHKRQVNVITRDCIIGLRLFFSIKHAFKPALRKQISRARQYSWPKQPNISSWGIQHIILPPPLSRPLWNNNWKRRLKWLPRCNREITKVSRHNQLQRVFHKIRTAFAIFSRDHLSRCYCAQSRALHKQVELDEITGRNISFGCYCHNSSTLEWYGILPYMGYIGIVLGMCRCEAYGNSRIGYKNQSV